MKTRHEYGNKPEYSEHDEETAEDVKFKDDNENAKAAFIIDQRHDAVPGKATPDGVQAEPSMEVVLITDVIDRRTGALKSRRSGALYDRRNGTTIDRRIGAS